MDRYLYMFISNDTYFISGPYTNLAKVDEVIERLREEYKANNPEFRLVFLDEHLRIQKELQGNY